MADFDSEEIVQFDSQKDFEKWLDKNASKKTAVWLKMAKKGKGVTTITYDEAVEVGLCYGWIDGIMKRFDDTFVKQRFTPRGKRSIWSKINVGKAEALIKAGRMKPSGMAEVERARADGRWAKAYAGSKDMEVPADFAAALGRHPKAAAFFNTLNKQNKYAMLFRLHHVKKAETRTAKIEKFIQMLTEEKKIYQ